MTAKRRGSAEPALAAGAPAPPRTYRTTNLTLGVLPIEVVLYSAVSDSKGVRSQFVLEEDGYHSVGIRKYDKVTGENIDDESRIIKGVATEDGVVELSDEELKLGTERVCEIFKFINLKNLSDEEDRLICPSKYYQVRPGRVKVGRDYRPNTHAAKALLGVFKRMKALGGLTAIVRITITDGEPAKMGLLDSAGQLRILAYQDHIREELPLGDVDELGITPEEERVLDTVIKSMIIKYMPANPDETIPHLENLLKEKQATGQIVSAPDQISTSTGPTVDLLAALEQTLEMAKAK
jgi:non-homologous end joining protein Ku